jgi:hypothetical protein
MPHWLCFFGGHILMGFRAMNFKDVLLNLLHFFNTKKISHSLVGAFALKAYGYLRATSDIEFVVRSEDQAKIVAHLESIGYETLHCSAGFSNHLHPLAKLGRIDFIYVRGETAHAILSQSKDALILEGVSVPVAKPEHLVALKLFAARNDPARLYEELADIRHILKLPGLDMEEIRSYFEKYGQMERYYELTGQEDLGPRP